LRECRDYLDEKQLNPMSLFTFPVVYMDAPIDWGMNFQDPATKIAQGIQNLHHDIMFFIILIAIFTFWMLARTIYKFSVSSSYDFAPRRDTHGVRLEIFWTVMPSIILGILVVPSLSLLYQMDQVEPPQLTLKVTGNQWYWTYEYSDVFPETDTALDYYFFRTIISQREMDNSVRNYDINPAVIRSKLEEVQNDARERFGNDSEFEKQKEKGAFKYEPKWKQFPNRDKYWEHLSGPVKSPREIYNLPYPGRDGFFPEARSTHYYGLDPALEERANLYTEGLELLEAGIDPALEESSTPQDIAGKYKAPALPDSYTAPVIKPVDRQSWWLNTCNHIIRLQAMIEDPTKEKFRTYSTMRDIGLPSKAKVSKVMTPTYEKIKDLSQHGNEKELNKFLIEENQDPLVLSKALAEAMENALDDLSRMRSPKPQRWVAAQDTVSFDSYMIAEDDLEWGRLRLLEVDNRVVLPINTNIRVLLTGRDVIHNWGIPSLAQKCDALPGRLNQTDLCIDRIGLYYGQCSELCGVYHGFMPIVVEAVTPEEYSFWIKGKIEEVQKTRPWPKSFYDCKTLGLTGTRVQKEDEMRADIEFYEGHVKYQAAIRKEIWRLVDFYVEMYREALKIEAQELSLPKADRNNDYLARMEENHFHDFKSVQALKEMQEPWTGDSTNWAYSFVHDEGEYWRAGLSESLTVDRFNELQEREFPLDKYPVDDKGITTTEGRKLANRLRFRYEQEELATLMWRRKIEGLNKLNLLEEEARKD